MTYPRIRIAGTYATQDGHMGSVHTKKRGDCSGPCIFYRENIGNTFAAFASADSDPAEVAKWQEVCKGPHVGIGATNASIDAWWKEKRAKYPSFPWQYRTDLPSVWEYFYPGTYTWVEFNEMIRTL